MWNLFFYDVQMFEISQVELEHPKEQFVSKEVKADSFTKLCYFAPPPLKGGRGKMAKLCRCSCLPIQGTEGSRPSCGLWCNARAWVPRSSAPCVFENEWCLQPMLGETCRVQVSKRHGYLCKEAGRGPLHLQYR